MKCPACNREQPMSFRCRFCNADLVRQSAPPAAAGTPRPPAAPPAPKPPARGVPPAPPSSSYGFTAPAAAAAYPGGGAAASVNPYAAPAAAGDMRTPFMDRTDDVPLADRGARLAAQFIDGLLGLGACTPGFILMVIGAPPPGSEELTPLGIFGLLVIAVGVIALVVYQLIMLAHEGQTWGKRIMKCRIVMYDTGELPGLGRILGLRILVSGFIGAIPCIGHIYSIADPLFIFGEERRCLHDLIAGTKVVQAD